MISYFNKANDADEIGLVWANAIVNGVLCDLRDRSGPDTWRPVKVVQIGHSFGARVVTRTAFSGACLNPPRTLSQGPDLTISLQGAFSMNRFLLERSAEGAPYSGFADLAGRIVMTWSDHDAANPVANKVTGANHSGARDGYDRVWSDDDLQNRKHFAFVRCASDGGLGDLVGDVGDKRLVMIDATELIRYQFPGTGGGAHSDVDNRDVGRMMWQIIRRLAPVPGA